MSMSNAKGKIEIEHDLVPAEASHQLLFRTVADADGQISLPVDLETIAEKLGLQTEMH